MTELVAAIVIAGGRGSRLGRDKAMVVVAGEPLVVRAVALLGSLTTNVVVARGPQPEIPGLGVGQIPDPSGAVGPLAGIVAGLSWAAARGLEGAVAVLAVDHPAPDAGVFAALAARMAADVHAAVPVDVSGRLQPLHSVWHTSALPTLRSLASGGLASPTRALASLAHAEVPVAALPGDGARWLHNINVAADLVWSSDAGTESSE